MKVKRLLRFYRSAEKLNGFLDGLMEHVALQSGADPYWQGEIYAERIISIIEEKGKLADLWARLNGVMEGLTEGDRKTLFRYTEMRVSPSDEVERREIHRAVVKFSRRAASILNGGGEAMKLTRKYACLLIPRGDGGW